MLSIGIDGLALAAIQIGRRLATANHFMRVISQKIAKPSYTTLGNAPFCKTGYVVHGLRR
ncbi:hypothetical protein CSQ89_15330 [Chitinimonas sp. BJB300]|nr:hypothetical protein CSQ89_15330 [Chitinimonas sp. BJB300]